ncbi:sensor histidine kinase [Chitinophaga filiformis]|uniref:histidine kinase n=1 Tax=Chitinophaga filiformis TaxID=104663 RepID=A0A1G8EBS2_CHIFI|nr:ATP-binding protein [Chitinophaga filiformis]SDH67297.1 Signal transduction histidine kinase [Chitinophaga filiformis]
MMNATMGNALTRAIPALLLDLHGNLLYVNQGAAGWLQVPEGEFHPAGNVSSLHFNDVIGKHTGVYWPMLCHLHTMGRNACVDMYCHTHQWVQWRLTYTGEHFLLTGTDMGSRRPLADSQSLLRSLPCGLQQFTPEGIHCCANELQQEIWEAIDPAMSRPGYNLFEEPAFQETGLCELFEEVLSTRLSARKEILLGYRELETNGVVRILPSYYEATVFAVTDEQGLITSLQLVMKDITEKQLSFRRLEKSARLLDLIIEHLPIGYIQFDHFGFIRRINHAQREFFQYEYEETEAPFNIMSDPFARLYGLDKLFKDVMVGNKVIRVEKQLDFSKDSRWTAQSREVWLDLTLFPLKDPVDKQQIVAVLVNDITDRKLEQQMRNQLQRNTEQLHLFFDAVDMGYATMEKDGTLSFANRKAEEMAGRKIIPGEKIFEIMPELGYATPFRTRFSAALAGTTSASFSSYFPRRYKWYEFLITPMRDGTVSVFIRDITDSRNMQKDLFRANKQLNRLNKSLVNQNQQLEDFAHITSHNLRAPIANLKALMQMHNDSRLPQEKEQYLSLLQEVIFKIDETLNDLVDVVQIRKNVDMDCEQLAFSERLQYVKDVLFADIEKSGILLTTNFEHAPVLEFPRLYLDSILQNLITNAIRYRTQERRPRLHLTSWQENGYTILTAEDNGLGIDMERFGHKLFGFRKTFHKNKDAKGIGLFITKTQVEAMGGSIRAESTPGQGTKFIITFKTE